MKCKTPLSLLQQLVFTPISQFGMSIYIRFPQLASHTKSRLSARTPNLRTIFSYSSWKSSRLSPEGLQSLTQKKKDSSLVQVKGANPEPLDARISKAVRNDVAALDKVSSSLLFRCVMLWLDRVFPCRRSWTVALARKTNRTNNGPLSVGSQTLQRRVVQAVRRDFPDPRRQPQDGGEN